MPFVTVVSLGASAASEFISNAISSGGKDSKKDGNSTLRGLKIRRVGEDEFFTRDSMCRTNNETGNTTIANSHNSNGVSCNGSTVSTKSTEMVGSVRRKSVSFIDVSSIGKLALAPASESGYSSGSSGSSNAGCETSVVQSSNQSSVYSESIQSYHGATATLNHYSQNGTTLGLSNGNGQGSIQTKTTVLKSWLRNKLHLNKNGKYSFEGSLCNLAHFGVKVNKSLLVECTPDTEYSTKKFYTLKTIPNPDDEHPNEDTFDGPEDSNLFIKECLKTYTTPFVQLIPEKIVPVEDPDGSSGKRNGFDAVDGSQVPKSESPDNTRKASTPPEWFWLTSTQNHGIQLDEAGVALEGHLLVTYAGENLGDRYVQVKWDGVEEVFWLIVWKGDAGNEHVCKIDLGEVSEVAWLDDHKLQLENILTLQTEKRIPQLLRTLYVICCEVGCYEKASVIASPQNVERVPEVVELFQKVSVELLHEKRQAPKPPPKPKFFPVGLFTFQLDSLEFRLKTESGTPLEPYYVSVCLFDVRNSRKASEDFHCTVDINGVVTSQKALFRVSDASEHLFIVVRVEKTLQGTDSDAYQKGNPDAKAGTRISKLVTSSPLFTETEQYRMPLCWAARSVFSKPGSRSSSPIVETPSDSFTLDTESGFSPFYKYEKSDEDLIKALGDLRKPEKVAKLTLVPGSIRASIHEVKNWDELKMHDSAMVPVNEFPSQSTETFSTFSHLLYVYPTLLNLNPVAGKIRARNILCRVFLRTEDDIDASPLDTNPENGAIATYVLHHRTNPEWYSEIKLKLPVTLDPRLHLLFQFIHISCSFDKVTKAKQLENVVGYAWVPLLNKFRFIGGDHTLPIASSLPSGYLQIQPLGLGKGYSGPDIGWLEKCTFSVRLNLLSTVWTKCGPLGAFFAHAEKLLQKGTTSSNNSKYLHCDDENTIKTIKTLESMDLATLRDFFPTIVNQLCNIATLSKLIANAVLKYLIFAFRTMIETGLESVIQQYTKSRFLAAESQEASKGNISVILIDSWIDLFETGDGATIATSLEHSEHIFAMIAKSLAIQGFALTTANPEDSKLVKLIQLFTTELVQRSQSDHALSRGANDNLIKFISAMLSVMTQRCVVFAAINAYLACFGPGDSHKVQDFKFTLLQSLVEHPLFLELNSLTGDEETTRLDNIPWAKRHFLVATVMKQSRSGLGEVSNVRTVALKPIMRGLILHERSGMKYSMWTPWLRVVCEQLHRVSAASLTAQHSSRCSSVSTILSATAGTLVQAALNRSLIAKSSNFSTSSNCSSEVPQDEGFKKSTLSVRSLQSNGHGPTLSTNSSMTNISTICANGVSNGDRLSLDRMSLSNCDYLDAISAIKMSNPAAANPAESTVSAGSGTETIVNENGSNNGSGDRPNSDKDPSDIVANDDFKASISGNGTEAAKSNVVLRRYDKLNDLETSQLLLSGLYVLKSMGKEGLKNFWARGTSQERAGLLQMIHLACSHFTNARKNSTITRKKVVGIVVPPTMPPSPRSSLMPNKKWSSLPSKSSEDDDLSPKTSPKKNATVTSIANDWKALGAETTFICVDTLANLCAVCNGENSEMRDIIRTTLDVAKTSEDTRAMLGALENVRKIDELANIVFAKGNEDLSHQLFCELLHGLGTSYLINTCVAILGKLYMHNPRRTTSQSLLAISSLSLTPDFVHNFRKSLCLLENGMSVNDRSSFILSITEKLNYIDVQEFGPSESGQNTLKARQSLFKTLTRRIGPRRKEVRQLNCPNSLPMRLGTILNSLWLLKSCQNDYRTSELYLKLANSYSHFARARLRIDSFDSLKEEHLQRKRFSEALLCELHVAACLGRQSATAEVKKILLGISQNLKDEFEESADPPEEEDTTEELILRLENCVALCEKAERYELMLEVYRILVDIQESLSDYAALEHSYKQMSRACGLIQNKRERFLATYYRVALYHPKKHNASRHVDVFVYKEPNVTSLMEICNKVETAEGAIIVSGEVDQMPDDDNVYATITHLSPVPSESPRRKLWTEDFRKHQNVNRFTYDTPFTVKSQDRINVDNKAAVHQQWKRRTIITTDHTFPAVVARLRVVSSEEEDLSPIVVAIDDMQRRVTELRSEVHSMDLKRLQLRLQGSVSVQVNQGPLAYARAFLEKENEYPIQDINTLKSIFRDFVECCGELLIRNGHLISAEQADYQTQLESDYTRLCQVLSPVLGLPEVALNRMSRISVSSY